MGRDTKYPGHFAVSQTRRTFQLSPAQITKLKNHDFSKWQLFWATNYRIICYAAEIKWYFVIDWISWRQTLRWGFTWMYLVRKCCREGQWWGGGWGPGGDGSPAQVGEVTSRARSWSRWCLCTRRSLIETQECEALQSRGHPVGSDLSLLCTR